MSLIIALNTVLTTVPLYFLWTLLYSGWQSCTPFCYNTSNKSDGGSQWQGYPELLCHWQPHPKRSVVQGWHCNWGPSSHRDWVCGPRSKPKWTGILPMWSFQQLRHITKICGSSYSNSRLVQCNIHTILQCLIWLTEYVQSYNFVIAGIVQFRIQLLFEVEGDLTRRKRQAISNEDIIESVSCIVRELKICYVHTFMQYNAIA